MPNDVVDVFLGPEGIIKHAHPNTICLDFTTVGPETSKTISMKSSEKEIIYLDAPVSGGPEGVD
jgi:3-hydroxyisobutyrate dehydrogenase